MPNSDVTKPRRVMSYEMAGEMPSGGFYQVRIGGRLQSKVLRHVETLVRMAAEWLEEDEATDGRGNDEPT